VVAFLAGDVLLLVGLWVVAEFWAEAFDEDFSSRWEGAGDSDADCAADCAGSARELKAQNSAAHIQKRIEPDDTTFVFREDTLLPEPGRT
jgi:hypothetical protein